MRLMLAICSTGRCGDNGSLIGRVGEAAAALGGAGKVGYLQPQGETAEPAAWREAGGEARVRPCSTLHFHL